MIPGNRYRPTELLVVSKRKFLSVLTRANRAPGTTALDWSRTVPLTVDVLACGYAGAMKPTSTISAKTFFLKPMNEPPSVLERSPECTT